MGAMAKPLNSTKTKPADHVHRMSEPPEFWERTSQTPGGTPIRFRLDLSDFNIGVGRATPAQLQLHLTHMRMQLLRGFDELMCLDGLTGVEHLPHQIETVRKVLRRFRGRVLLADEVGLGKTIEACLLLREYLLRRLVRRVLILVPNPLVSQWHEELASKFHLDFDVPPRTANGGREEFYATHDRVLMSTSFARTGNRPEAIAATPWDLVIVDEAHHCRNRTTKLWKLVNSLQRRHMFLLTATPVQNNLVELYSLLTLLEPGHLKTEADFKRQFVTRGNPRDPRNRHRLRDLLGEVMIRNTRSLVQIDLPPRYAQTIVATPEPEEAALLVDVQQYLRDRSPHVDKQDVAPEEDGMASDDNLGDGKAGISRMRLQSILMSLGSHPATVAASLEPLAATDPVAKSLRDRAAGMVRSAKDERLLQILKDSAGHKVLVFVGLIRTLHNLQMLLTENAIEFSTFSGEQTVDQKDAAVERLRTTVDVMLCTESGGEGRNLQFADTLVNYDLPWNPMKIEQRIGRVHRYGQKQDVFIFNLCTAGSLESRILTLLNDKIRMFELVVGEVGSILGNLDDGQEFESLVLQMWQKSRCDKQLDSEFDKLGETLLTAQEKYLGAKELDEALFGEDYE